MGVAVVFLCGVRCLGWRGWSGVGCGGRGDVACGVWRVVWCVVWCGVRGWRGVVFLFFL